eukprot:1404088-Pleurochrysis_carterae.AAC.2
MQGGHRAARGIELARAQRATFGRHWERHSDAPNSGKEGGAGAVAIASRPSSPSESRWWAGRERLKRS